MHDIGPAVRLSNAPAGSLIKPGSNDNAPVSDDGHATDDEESKTKSDSKKSVDESTVAAEDEAESGDPEKRTKVESQIKTTGGEVAQSVTADKMAKEEPRSPGVRSSAPVPRPPPSPGPLSPTPLSPGPGGRPVSPGPLSPGPVSPGPGGRRPVSPASRPDGRPYGPEHNALCDGCRVGSLVL